ncbi:hypothetical protein [Streptomyces sp. NBC_00576]|nr:hypothetical protein [Streptomyces sp. NBC_00576]WUB72550.1 hypothetical protein OG734_21880 [Streptomyces sp. NBC_00576]
MEEPLGPFQDIWDAWQEADDEIARARAEHRMKGQASQILGKYADQYGI